MNIIFIVIIIIIF